MVAQGFATDGDAFFEDDLGFGFGEGVAFDGVGVVGEANGVDFPQVFEQVRVEGAQGIDSGFEPIEFLENIHDGSRISHNEVYFVSWLDFSSRALQKLLRLLSKAL